MIEHPAGVSSATTDGTVRAGRFHDNPTTTRLAEGGFLLLRPSRRVFDALVAIVTAGDYREGQGWEGTRIGVGYVSL